MRPNLQGACATVAFAYALSVSAALAGTDEFVISLEQQVSDGVPGPGAGNLESPGSIDVYTLTVAPGTVVYFDEKGGPCNIQWECQDSNGVIIFDDVALCSGDPGVRTLAIGGEYTMTVSSSTSATGTYSFIVWEVDPAQEFAIALEQPVSNGVPAVGAGNIEEPGAIDIYTFEADPGAIVYFDETSGPCAIRWRCVDELDAVIFDDVAFCVNDPTVFELTLGGTYTITAYGAADGVGTYSFIIWEVNPPEQFELELEAVVSNGVPGPGAGNIEEPGAIDLYTFEAEAGTLAFFDELSGHCSIRWLCEDPLGGVIFSDTAMCVGDPGVHELTMDGTYTVTVYGLQSITGVYSFGISIVNPVDSFAITLEQPVSNGVPAAGAGNIEEPGAIDEYTFTADAGTEVFFNALSGSCSITMECRDPFDAVLFDGDPLCLTGAGLFTLPHTGQYTVRVRAVGGATGTYSFTIWEVDPPQEFVIDLDDMVSDGVPGPGAGNIEEPGAVDIYTFTASAGQSACFAEIIDNCALRWSCEDDNGTPIFTDEVLCAENAGKFELALGGEFTITVRGTADGVGTYGFVVEPGRAADINGNCIVDVLDLLQLLGDWGPCPRGEEDCPSDTDDSGEVDVLDLLDLLGSWG